MSEFLDELARSLARPMPRRRALRVLGGALVTVATPASLFAGRANASSAIGCDKCGVPHGAGCVTPGDCGKFPLENEPVCCRWPSYFGPIRKPYGGLCAQAGGNGLQPPGGAACCCPKGTSCGNPAVAACSCAGERCGTKCCDKDEICASARHGLCCRKDNDLTRHGRLEPAEKPCVGSKGARCCPTGTNCCQGKSCCWPGQKCVNGQCACSGKQTVKCGSDCCDPETEKCCFRFNGRRIQHCVPKDRVCCGTVSCPKGVKCCGGVNCAGGPEPEWDCCGTEPYDDPFIDCCQGVLCARGNCDCGDPEDDGCVCTDPLPGWRPSAQRVSTSPWGYDSAAGVKH